MLGGKCLVCGYSRCLAALDFHHTDPAFKTSRVASLLSQSWKKAAAELRYCVLLCCRCHAELHAGVIRL
jgi:hypothetical protein